VLWAEGGWSGHLELKSGFLNVIKIAFKPNLNYN
jgi:hypothetical protein